MRYSTLLHFAAAAATAIVIPDGAMMQQLVLEQHKDLHSFGSEWASHESSWWEKLHLPSLDDLRSSVEDVWSDGVDGGGASLSSPFLDSFLSHDGNGGSTKKKFDIELPSLSDFLPSWSRPGKGGRGGHHGGASNLTLYQAIKASNYTTKIAKLVDEFPGLVAALNCTKTNLTMFVPTDKAFEKIPDHGDKKPPREIIEKVLKYHVVPGLYPAGRVLASHTLPTILKADGLGGQPQRLRASVGLFGVKINFYSKVVVTNIFLANGIAHGIDSLLVPPPPAGKIIKLFPSKFSTLLLAVSKTGVGKELSGVKTTGGTFFAPTNRAFDKLGPAANAFLFNTEKGLGYLAALLKYHIVVNETLYSDAFYGPGHHDDGKHDEDEARAIGKRARYHVDLPTLLDDKSLSIDVARWGGFITIKINGFTRVAVQDVLARDAVIQVVDSVLIPPREKKRPGRGSSSYVDGDEIDVEELIERLEPYVGSGKDFAPGEL